MKFKQENAHQDSIWALATSRNETDLSDYIVTGGVDDMVKLWKWKDNQLESKYTMDGHQLGIISVAMNNTATIAASTSLDSNIRLWDVELGKPIKVIDAGSVDAWQILFSVDSKYLFTGSQTGKINMFSVETGNKDSSLDTRGTFTLSIAVSPDGKCIASGAIDGIINIFDIETSKLVHTLEGHALPIRALCFSPDSQLLITASDDNHIKIYDVLALVEDVEDLLQHANLAGTLSGHASWVLNVDFAPDNSRFVSCSSDKTVKIWDAGQRTCLETFDDHTDQVWSARYNATGTSIFTVSEDKSLHVYDVPTN